MKQIAVICLLLLAAADSCTAQGRFFGEGINTTVGLIFNLQIDLYVQGSTISGQPA